MEVSAETKQRLIRFAVAMKRWETEIRRLYYRDGYIDIPPSRLTVLEWSVAKDDLKLCTEPEIKQWVWTDDIARLDEVGADESKTELDVIAAGREAMLARNELVALGHNFKQEQDRNQPRKRRKEHGRSRNRKASRRPIGYNRY
jgi:hypothetical protein